MAKVHAQQRRTGRAGQLGGAQNRAVPANHDDDLSPLGRVRAGRHLFHARAGDIGCLGLEDAHVQAGLDEPLDDEAGAPERILPPGVRHDQSRPPAAADVHCAHFFMNVLRFDYPSLGTFMGAFAVAFMGGLHGVFTAGFHCWLSLGGLHWGPS